MRLLLLPISTRRALIYCEPPSHSLPSAQQTRLDKVVQWSSRTWSQWEKSDTKWKLKTTQYGNKMLRRIPFEEWGLKSIPSLSKKRRAEIEEGIDGEAQGKRLVDVRFPGQYQTLAAESVMDVCRRLSLERQPLHKKRMIWSVVGMPFTIPVGLLPIIPNLPFFYLAFRFYSHWRALLGSQHLEFLVQRSLLRPRPDDTLDGLYSAGLLHATRADSRSAPDPTPEQSRQIVRLIRRQMMGEDLDAPGGPGGPVAEMAPNTQKSAGVHTIEAVAANEDNEGHVQVKAPPKHGGRRQPKGGEAGADASGPGRPAEDEEIMLLKGWNGKLIAERLGLPGLEIEIERAVEQVENDLKKGDELHEEKKEIEKAARTPQGQSK